MQGWPWNEQGPLSRPVLDAVIRTVQQRLDLLAVLSERYGQQVDDAGERWRTQCFLPSLVSDFVGSCAEQDATEMSGEVPRNLWVSDGDTTRVWRCHSCKRHGDVIDLIEHADKLPRGSQAVSLRAVRVAAQLAGVAYLMDGREPAASDEAVPELVAVQATTASAVDKPRVPFAIARAVNATVASYWREQLHGPNGLKARDELARRGISLEQADAYQLGYALPQWRDVAQRLQVDWREHALALGLLGRNRHGNVYDRQRDRLIFPYCEPERDGRPPAITGFTGRTLSDDPKAPKWLNSENAPGVWEKRSALFGHYQAAELARTSGYLKVTEGASDTLAYMRAGQAAVALVSAALTPLHLAVISAELGSPRLTIAFDGDDTGRREALSVATTALAFGLAYDELRIVDPGDGRDPDDRPVSELQQPWSEQPTVAAFAREFGELLSLSRRVALLAELPTEEAGALADTWQIEPAAIAKHRDRVTASTPLDRLAAALQLHTQHAPQLGAREVDELFVNNARAREKLADLTFGEHTDLADLPRDLRRRWVTCRLQHVNAEASAHASRDPFELDNSADGFRTWFQRDNELRAEQVKLKRELDALDNGE